MAEYDDEDGMVIAAAEILLSLRKRDLVRWPEWIPRPSNDTQRPEEEAEDDVPPIPEGWPKRPRLPARVVVKGTAWFLSLKRPFGRLGHPALPRSGACSSGEERAREPLRVTVVKRESFAARRPETPPYYVSATGSVPSTSGIDRARSRRRQRVSEKAAQATATAWTDGTMAASSPETPFDYANAAGSGASSSGDEMARWTAKRKTPASGGSGGPSSGDEGCSSPAKRTLAVVVAAGQATVKVETPLLPSTTLLSTTTTSTTLPLLPSFQTLASRSRRSPMLTTTSRSSMARSS